MTKKIRKILLKTEEGRSMVEMLGVLAIIGVLSVAGISGYTTAMARHRANEAAQKVSIAFVELEAAANLHGQQNASIDSSLGSSVTLAGTSEYPNAGIVINFGNDVRTCKQFYQMYESSSNFYPLNECGE